MAASKQATPAAAAASCLALLLLLQCSTPAHALVTRVRVFANVEGPSPPKLGTYSYCDQVGSNYTCTSSCEGSISGMDRGGLDYCYTEVEPACNGRACAMQVDVVATLDRAPSTVNPRIMVSAHPVFEVKLRNGPIYDRTARPITAKWTYDVIVAVSVGQFYTTAPEVPHRPLITFTAAQGNAQVAGVTNSIQMTCASLSTARAQFTAVKADCKGKVVALANVWGCPDIYDARAPNAYLEIFDGNVTAATTTARSSVRSQYPVGMQVGDPFRFVATVEPGVIRATFRRTRVDPEGEDTWPSSVHSLKVGHRFYPLKDDTPFIISTASAKYTDQDSDGWGHSCDCNDKSFDMENNCGTKKKKNGTQ